MQWRISGWHLKKLYIMKHAFRLSTFNYVNWILPRSKAQATEPTSPRNSSRSETVKTWALALVCCLEQNFDLLVNHLISWKEQRTLRSPCHRTNTCQWCFSDTRTSKQEQTTGLIRWHQFPHHRKNIIRHVLTETLRTCKKIFCCDKPVFPFLKCDWVFCHGRLIACTCCI